MYATRSTLDMLAGLVGTSLSALEGTRRPQTSASALVLWTRCMAQEGAARPWGPLARGQVHNWSHATPAASRGPPAAPSAGPTAVSVASGGPPQAPVQGSSGVQRRKENADSSFRAKCFQAYCYFYACGGTSARTEREFSLGTSFAANPSSSCWVTRAGAPAPAAQHLPYPSEQCRSMQHQRLCSHALCSAGGAHVLLRRAAEKPASATGTAMVTHPSPCPLSA
jgi:hypothetical protein